ncbi:(2Fe-2S)-binding protein [Candidatus Fermentibacteria bacterium]|nr:(2Fe-2S)-binding protein [Candidatus Fermentibacteria bacterium]
MTEVRLTIDGRETTAPHRSPLLDAIRGLGIDVPTLCHMDGLEPYGVCRMCIVEVKRGRRTRLVTSCNFPVEQGLEVFTDTERIRQHRRILAELMLARCPDVPKVRELAASVGVTTSRFHTMAASDCVMCGLCVRVCDEIVGASALSFVGRGNVRIVGTPWSVDPESCIACGACVYVCPTGAMHMEEKTTERWRRELGSDKRMCRYARMGLISYKICPNDFRCAECEVDQRIFEEFGTHPILAIAPGLRQTPIKVGPFDVVEDRFYSRGHAWATMTGDHARVGMDDFARQLVGPIGKVIMHAMPGHTIRAGDAAATVTSDGHSLTLRAPVSGTVTHVNGAVVDDPALLDEDCYGRGWLFTIQPDDFYLQSRRLVGREQVKAWIDEQWQRLAHALEAMGHSELTPGFAHRISHADFVELSKEHFESEATSP